MSTNTRQWIKYSLFGAVVGIGLMFAVGTAYALFIPSINRDEYVTFFRGQFFTGFGGGNNAGAVFPSPAYTNVNNVDQFVQTTHDYLYNPAPNPDCCHDANDQIGAAAYLVDSMLGKKGPDFGGDWNAGVAYAKANWGTWEATVRYYNAQGWANFNDAYSYCSPYFHFNEDYTLSDVFGYEKNDGCNVDISITFSNPSGGHYVIFKDCGNPNGDQEPLSPPSNPPTGTLATATCTQVTGTAHEPDVPGYAVQVRLTYSTGQVVMATASTSSPYTFTSPVPAAIQSSLSAVTVTAVGIRSDGTTTFALTGSPKTFGPCTTPSGNCGAMTVSPSSIDPGTPFTVTTSVRYASLAEANAVRAQAGFRYYITIRGPSGYNFSQDVVPTGPDAVFAFTGTVARPATGISGNFIVGWGVAGGVGAVSCGDAIPGNINPPQFHVLNLPYFKVLGGDVSAGAGMSVGGVDCAVSANNNASIVSWNRGAAGGYDGAGTRYSALALNHLQDFATGQGSGNEPIGFSFANNNNPNGTVNIGGGLFGGKFSAAPCESDYFGKAPAGSIEAGPITIGGMAVANNTHTTRYIDGNVYITGNITFSGNYPTVASIPTYTLVVRGNIYVAPGVTRLDGFYIAQPTNAAATNGILYSCAPSGFGTNSANVLTDTLQADCGQPLTINGAVAARQVWLLRAAGSVTNGTPAETVNYLPEMWMSAPYDTSSSSSADDYDSITSLPPVL